MKAHTSGGKRRRPRLLTRLAMAAVTAVIGVAACSSGNASHDPSTTVTVQPPPLRGCLADSSMPCYAQDPLHRVYDLGQLYARGITGAGTTVAVIDGANPGVRADLAAFSRYLRLPPAQLRVLSWDHGARGRPEPAAAREATADLELMHFVAPRARLLYVEVPSRTGKLAQTAFDALGTLATHQQIDVVSLSWGLPEAALTAGQIQRWRAGLITATRHRVSVIAATGDSGPTLPGFHTRTVAWPASDPLVAGVGAVTLDINPNGKRLSPDTVTGGQFPTGAGVSRIFSRPAYQNRVARVVGDHRGVADVSMDCSMWVYVPFPSDGQGQGWMPDCGTSFSAPLFAGIVALADQMAGHPLGQLNPLLYRLRGPADGVLDVTQGSNTYQDIRGYAAGPGYDLPSGIGTVGNAPAFVIALTRLAARQ